MFKISPFNWLKALSPLAISATMLLAIETPAQAIPHISIYSGRHDSGNYYRQRRVYAPPSLNITPPPGRHIPLPRYSQDNYYPHGSRGYSHYHHHHDRKRRHYDKRYKRVIIINPVYRY